MPKKRHTPGEIIQHLRPVEIERVKGVTCPPEIGPEVLIGLGSDFTGKGRVTSLLVVEEVLRRTHEHNSAFTQS